MRKLLIIITLALSFLPVYGSAYADMAPETRTPLVVIRFTERNVYYEKALYNAVAKAVETKPDVVFDVVAMPGLRSSTANNHSDQVARSIEQMGIPAGRIVTRGGMGGSGEGYDQVNVFVR